jgi:hypothetical protein
MAARAKGQPVINEIMASNSSFMYDPVYYNFSDWVEIHNSGSSSVSLGAYYLSDDIGDLKKWELPVSTLPSNGYYVIFCDKQNSGSHANFGLRTEGEIVFLSDGAGNILSYLEYGQQYPDVSYGRDPADPGQLRYCATPTPGSANSVIAATSPGPRAGYSIPAGRLTATAALSLSGDNVHYTTEGSEPTVNNATYSNPIPVSKTMTVKTRTFQDGFLPGETYTNTYFLNEHAFTLPVVSLSFKDDYFYDDKIGIHVRGINGTAGYCGDVANWNQDWERPVYFEYFDEAGVKRLSQSAGVKIAGGCTRGRDQKALSIYARGKYGDNDFDYTFFREKPDINRFPSVLLRNSGNDQDQTLLRDAFLQALVKPSMDIDYQAYQPAIVYFNGEYRGIMNLREKTNEDYVRTNYYLDEGVFDMLERDREIINGSADDYTALVNFLNANSLASDANYQQVASQIDIQEFINWLTVHLYIGNRDWPGNNHKFWKTIENGKWRWLLFDLDYGFGFRLDDPNYTHMSFDEATATDGSEHPNPPWSTLLFRKLLENQGFKKQFLSTYLTHVYSSFDPKWCNYVLDSLSHVIDFEIYYNQVKFGRTKNQWTAYLNTLREYAVNRQGFMPGYTKSFFNLNSAPVTLNISNPDTRKGKVRVNQALVQMYPLTLHTYQELPMTIEAVPAKGYRFNHWIDKSNSTTYSYDILLASPTGTTMGLEPVFETIEATGGISLNEIAPSGILFQDEDGENSGFIELFNNAAAPAVLNSWFLSDRHDNLTRYAIPDSLMIPAGGFRVLYADGDARQGELHTVFRLSTNGETVYLSQKVGEDIQVRDSIRFDFLVENHSYGRYGDGNGAWRHMVILTPGMPNNPLELSGGPDLVEAGIRFSVYPNPTAGQLFIAAEGIDIYDGDYQVDLVDMTGKPVYPRIWLNQAQNHLNLSGLDGGLYIIRIFSAGRMVNTSRIILIK